MDTEFVFGDNKYQDRRTASKKYELKGAGNVIRKNVEDPGREEFIIALDIILRTGEQLGKAKPELSTELLKIRDSAPFLHDRPNPIYLAGGMVVWDALGRQDKDFFEDPENADQINEVSEEVLKSIRNILEEAKRRSEATQSMKEKDKSKELTLYRTIIMITSNIMATSFK